MIHNISYAFVDLFDTTQYDSLKLDGKKESVDHKQFKEHILQFRPAPKHDKIKVRNLSRIMNLLLIIFLLIKLLPISLK